MPRVMLTEAEKMNSKFTAELQKQRALYDKRSPGDIQRIIGKSYTAVHARDKNPGLYTVTELRRLFASLRFSNEQILTIFGR